MQAPSLRGAKRRSNPDCRRGGSLDCFASHSNHGERYDSAFSRRVSPELCISIRPPKRRGRREGRVAACTRGRRAKKICASAMTTGTGGDNRPSLRSGLRLIRALPGEPAFATVAFAKLSASPGLSACIGAPGPHDFAVRECAARPTAHPRPPHSAPRS
jgi:hypothetical protein